MQMREMSEEEEVVRPGVSVWDADLHALHLTPSTIIHQGSTVTLPLTLPWDGLAHCAAGRCHKLLGR